MGTAKVDGSVALPGAASARWTRICFQLVAFAPAAGVLVAAFERRWMDDDGFINLRIVRNMLHGAGAVFNVDERVEAGTSPVWLGVIALLGELGAPLERAAVFGGIALMVIGLLAAQDAALHLNGARSRAHRWRMPPLPVGAALFAALPPVWDYASSGLETALGLAWLASSFHLLARGEEPLPGRRLAATSVVVGLGPLIRPEFALYSLGFLFVLARTSLRSRTARTGLARLTTIAACAGALPLSFEIFRMGYYASTIPNTGIAKEAFLSNWEQGRHYFDNFFVTYRLAVSLPAAGLFWIARLRDHARSGRSRAFDLTLAAPIVAALHVFYIVRLGGDYMHGRQLIPPVFAALMPVMMAPVSLDPLPSARVLYVAATGVVALWVPWCALRLRVGVENVDDIGDERGWYAREAHVANPVDIESYRAHFFFADAEKDLSAAVSACPPSTEAMIESDHAGCRRLYQKEDQPQIAPAPTLSNIAAGIDPRVRTIVSEGAIGISGYLLPAGVHIVDRHGLADPVVARFELLRRGRPGHEKKTSAAWLLARFAEPAGDDDAAVVAARHALQCGPLAALDQAVTTPLTFQRFFDNLVHAWAYTRLRIPRDPFEAEAFFCGTPPPTGVTAGGTGGDPYRWRCSAGASMIGLRTEFKADDKAVSLVQPLCRRSPDALQIGPTIGESSATSLQATCPLGSTLAGLYGTSDNLVRSVGLVCARDGVTTRVNAGGVEYGNDFSLACPGPIVGVEGRSGRLIDAVGVACAPAGE